MDENKLNRLYQPLEVKERKGAGNQQYKYISNEDVIDRMNRTFMGNWSTKIVSKEVMDDYVLVEVQVSVFEEGFEYVHTGFGSHMIARYTTGANMGKIIDIGNAYKSALAKAIVNACTRWGVGLFKDRSDFGEEDYNDTPVSMPSLSVAPPVSAPAVAPIQAPVPPVFSPAPLAAPSVAPVQASPKPIVPAMPTMPPVPSAPAVAVPPVFTPPGAHSVQTTPKVPVPNFNPAPISVPAPVSSAPAPVQSVPTFTPPQDLPFSSSDDLGLISDVQKVALNGLLSMRKLNYNELAAEAFESVGLTKEIPPVEQLKYEDAVIVLKYGNEKYRKNK